MDTTVTIELAPIARDLSLPQEQLRRTVELLDEGNTVPFITRYRKDLTGGLDEEQIRQVQDRVTRARMLAERKKTILKSIESQGKLTEELAAEIQRASSTKRLEDLYLPFKPKKQTLATVARDRGLEPLAREILSAAKIAEDLDLRARDFIDEDKGIRSQADVLLGVGHLVAEHFSERAELREALRRIVRDTGRIACTKIEAAEQEPAAKPSESDKKTAPAEDSAAIAEAETDVASAPTTDAQPASPAPDDVAAAETPVSDDATASDEATAAEAEAETPAEAEATTEAPPTVAGDEEPAGAEPAAAAAEASPESASAGDAPSGEVTSGEDETTEATASPQPAAPSEPTEAEKEAAKATEQEKKKQQRAERKKRKQEAKKRKQKQKENAYKDYFNFTEATGKLPPHRILAINRGEKARVLRVKLDADLEAMRAEAEKLAIPEGHPHAEFLHGCLKDALARLILPALERELRRELTDKAEDHAVSVFARNLRHLLLTQPVSGHRVLAIDPGFRSGCKLAAIDEFGNMHGHGAIFLVGPEERKQRSRARLIEMIKMHKITVVAIGNGTACRETEHLVADVLANELKDAELSYVIVNEAGASVYSTSPVGREELGKLEAAQRSAVSIGRRLLDPLSELVKINPANIGVGLYQHDMKAKHLQDSLDAVVESCVNYVGVDVNTASPSLLRYVSGLNQLTARRLYEHRQQNGPFASREQLKDVPGVGDATYVQAAGFLKISGGENPLDATWIHPESYDSARQLLEKLGGSVEALAAELNVAAQAPAFAEGLKGTETREAIEATTEPTANAEAAVAPATEEKTDETAPTEAQPTDTAVDAPKPEESPQAQVTEAEPQAPTTTDTAAAEQPAVEPKTESAPEATPESPPTETPTQTQEAVAATPSETPPPASELLEKAASVNSTELAGELGIGALLCQDILTSLTRPGRDPREDLPSPIFRREILKLEDLKPGMQLQGTVLNVVDFGAFVDIGLHDTGLVHISRLADRYIKDPHEVVGVGDTIDIWVMSVDKQRRRVQLTAIKPGTEKPQRKRGERGRRDKPTGEAGKRPPRRDGKDKRKSGEGGRRPRQRRDKRDDHRGRHQRGPAKPFELQSKKEKKEKLTKAKKEGRKPLQTFGELAQFMTLQDAPEEEPTKQPEAQETAEKKDPQVAGDAGEAASGSTPNESSTGNVAEEPAADQVPNSAGN